VKGMARVFLPIVLLALAVVHPSVSSGAAGTIAVGMSIDPRTLDPRSIGGDLAWTEMHHVLEPLHEYDNEGVLHPMLAESYRRVNDLTWQFKLRKNVKFHNGEPFTAASVKYTIESALDPNLKFVNAHYVRDVAKVEIIDEHTVNLVTKTPTRSMLTNLAWVYMLPPKAAQELGDRFGTNPIGTGPFKFVRYVANAEVEMAANEGYWGTPPKTKSLIWKALPEDATRNAALEAGEVQAVPNVSPDVIARLRGNPNLDVVVIDGTRIVHLAFSLGRPPFDNVKVRQAFNYAVDRKALVETILGGMGAVADRHYFHPTTYGFNEKLAPYSFDPAKAKALLAEAGHPNGIKVKFGCPQGRYLRDKVICEAIVEQFKKSGITSEFEALEWGSFWDKAVKSRVYDLYLLSWGGSVDPQQQLSFWFDSRNSPIKYSNARLDQLMVDGQRVMEPARGKAIYQELQDILWADMPWVPLYFQPEIFARNKNVSDMNIRRVVPLLDFRRASMKP